MRQNATIGIVRGGQATQHFMRMTRQVTLFSLGTGLIIAVLAGLILSIGKFPENAFQNYLAYEFAELRVGLLNDPDRMVTVHLQDGSLHSMRAHDVVAQPLIRAQARYVEDELAGILQHAAIAGGVALVLSFAVFVRVGNRLSSSRHIRGQQLVTPAELKLFVQAKWKAHRKAFGKNPEQGRWSIAGIPTPPNALTSGIGIYGTTGAGKTVLIKSVLDQIAENGGRAIVYDRTGALVRDFYDPDRDLIYNPFDARSVGWTPFADATTKRDFEQMAEVMIPDRGRNVDQFWVATARLVFADTAFTLAREAAQRGGTPQLAFLQSAILNISNEKLAELLDGQRSELFFTEDNSRTAASIRSSVIAELKFLDYLRDDTQVMSVRKWVKSDRPGFLFLTSPADQAAACRNTISTMIEVAANALPHLGETYHTRLFFVLDELPTLNRIPALLTSLATLRQFGAAFMLGFQVNSQLEEIYGREGATTIAGTLNTVAVFSTPDYQTAEACSKRLGMQDQEEMNESISLGAHTARDGVSVMARRQERAIVTASEIQSLPQFKAYLQFAYDAPVTEVTVKPLQRKAMAEGFVDQEPLPHTGDEPGAVFVEPTFKQPTFDPLDMEQTFPGAYAMDEPIEPVSSAGNAFTGEDAAWEVEPETQYNPPAAPAKTSGTKPPLRVVAGTEGPTPHLARLNAAGWVRETGQQPE